MLASQRKASPFLYHASFLWLEGHSKSVTTNLVLTDQHNAVNIGIFYRATHHYYLTHLAISVPEISSVLSHAG